MTNPREPVIKVSVSRGRNDSTVTVSACLDGHVVKWVEKTFSSQIAESTKVAIKAARAALAEVILVVGEG